MNWTLLVRPGNRKGGVHEVLNHLKDSDFVSTSNTKIKEKHKSLLLFFFPTMTD